MGGTGGRRTAKGFALISALTAAMPAMTKNLALELAPVRVNLIAAGFVDTPLSASLLGNQLAVGRLKRCENIVAQSEELGVHRQLVYKWRDQLDPVDVGDEAPPANPRESTLRKEVSQLKRLLADKTLEVDFFKGALQKVEARRQRGGNSGEKASTTRSGK
jgi:NAD(P)-dependent dehydrogenase (short-subunit alcohol dehydrogenase family)